MECHGTGTPLGDPIEVAGLTQAFRLGTDRRSYCAIGSLKTAIGHLDAAAGVAGLIKTTLALWHRQMPPSLNFASPNPKIDFASSPFFVNDRLREWPAGPAPRRAAVSSFGAGGTNAHVVLEEAPVSPAGEPAEGPQLLLVSARTAAARDRAVAALATHLEHHEEVALADAAFTLQMGRQPFAYWAVASAMDSKDAAAVLRDEKRVRRGQRDRRAASLAFLFPGQGAQAVHMGRDLYMREAVFRQSIDESAETLRSAIGLDLRSVLYPSSGEEEDARRRLAETSFTQPALFAIEYALARLLESWGVTAAALCGHSLGEYVAACLAGTLTHEDALHLLARRSALMQQLPRGGMLAVRLAAAELRPLLPAAISVAGINAVDLTVISGPTEAIDEFGRTLAERRVGCKALATSHAFHSSMMDAMLPLFAEALGRVSLRAPTVPWVSTRTGDWISEAEATDPSYWCAQLREPVRFADAVGVLLRDPDRVLVEVGPGQNLSALAIRHPERVEHQAVVTCLDPRGESANDVSALQTALGRLWFAGAPIDWPRVHGNRRRRIALPGYPFERRRYWMPVATGVTTEAAIAADTPPGKAPEKEAEVMPQEIEAQGSSSGRREDLVVRLQRMFAELAGAEPDAMSPRESFLEIGFDSLFLTQAIGELEKAFGVRVSFRELLEELPTIGALADHLDQLLPARSVPGATLPTGEPVSTAPARGPERERTEPTGPVESGGTLERILARQLELMAQQLEILRAGGVDTPRTGVPADSRNEPVSATAPRSEPLQPVATAAVHPEQKSFGPYRPAERSADNKLSAEQQAALDSLIERYTARTARSKELTQASRSQLADPRTAAGFRKVWKEIVYPIVTERSAGSRLWDVDGNEYVDYTCGFGAILLGHAPDFVVEAVASQLARGFEIGPQSPLASEVAALVCELTGMERAAFCNTGSEAVTAAFRMARTVTGRDKIAMFEGAYHGVFDEVLMRPITSGGMLQSRPVAPGIPAAMGANIVVLKYAERAALEYLEAHGREFAAVIVEPVQSRRPEIQPREFCQELRKLTTSTGAALVFDEVVTGFRAHPRGCQGIFDVTADIATYGKVVCGGLPIGIVAGSARYLDALDGGHWKYGDASGPDAGVTFFAGTFVRHPLALAAARAVLLHLKKAGPELQRALNVRTRELVQRLNREAQRVGAPVTVTSFSSFFAIDLPREAPLASLFHAYMRVRGMYLRDGGSNFLTTAHGDEDLDRLVRAFAETLVDMQQAGFLPIVLNGHQAPVPGARLGRDQNGESAWFVPDDARPGKYLRVVSP